MTNKSDTLNLNCEVQLLRYNGPLTLNNVNDTRVLSKDINNLNTEVKRSSRIARKRSFQDKSIAENENELNNKKKKICTSKKSIIIKAEKPIINLKETKKIKNQVSASVKSTSNNDLIKTTNADHSIDVCIDLDHNTNISISNPIETLANKKFKSIRSSKKKSVVININKDEISNELETNGNTVPLKTQKNKKSFKSISSTTIKKKNNVVNNVNTNDIFHDHNASNNIVISQKRGNSLLKKIQCQKTDVDNVYYNKVDLQQTENITENMTEKLHNKTELTEKFDANTMINKSDKPPKIKQKWSDEWCGDELTNSIKPYGDSKLSVNKDEKLVKKNIKNRKTTKLKKIKMFQKLDTKTKGLQSTNSSNTCDNLDQSTNIPVEQYKSTNNLLPINTSNTLVTTDQSKNIPVAQTHDNILISNNIPLIENVAVNNHAITDSINFNLNTNESSETTSSSIVPISTGMSESVVFNQPSQFESNFSYLTPTINTDSSEISYGISILSEAVSRQSRESSDKGIKKKSQNKKEIIPSPKNSRSKSSSATSSQKVYKSISGNVVEALCEQSVETSLQANLEHGIHVLSKRFNIPIDSLRNTVVNEPLSVFQKKYSKSITPSMVTISPIVKDVETKFNYAKYVSGNLDIEYKVEPIRESAAYEKTNLKDLMAELSKTMPSWSLSIVTNPPRYIISHMSINMYGVPNASKCIVLDRYFRASVYINQCLEYSYCKRYTTATEIINLIKTLNSL